jgi:chromosome segregation ATPase
MDLNKLKQEAEKGLDKRLGTYAYIRKQDCYTNYVDGYIDSAEPREKRIAELEDKLANADYQLEGRDLEIKELKAQIEKMKQDLDSARENANRQEQWEIYSVLNGIYNDNFEVITSVSN